MVAGNPKKGNGGLYTRLYRCLKCGATVEREVGGWRRAPKNEKV
jgi:hypothetical protein